jgi:hypothetical protein
VPSRKGRTPNADADGILAVGFSREMMLERAVAARIGAIKRFTRNPLSASSIAPSARGAIHEKKGRNLTPFCPFWQIYH